MHSATVSQAPYWAGVFSSWPKMDPCAPSSGRLSSQTQRIRKGARTALKWSRVYHVNRWPSIVAAPRLLRRIWVCAIEARVMQRRRRQYEVEKGLKGLSGWGYGLRREFRKLESHYVIYKTLKTSNGGRRNDGDCHLGCGSCSRNGHKKYLT